MDLYCHDWLDAKTLSPQPYFLNTLLEIRETGRAAAIDFRYGRFTLLDQADPRKLACIVPGEELLFFLKFPFGADTMNISACHHVSNRDLWNSLLTFRNSLYLGNTMSLKRTPAKIVRRYVLRLDERHFGGIVRRAYSLLRVRLLKNSW